MKEVRSGRLLAIARRERSRAPMTLLEQADITTRHGVVGDFRGKPGARQVTVLSADDWAAACKELGKQLPWLTRRANLCVAGITFRDTTGQLLRIGEVVLQITGETDPCSRMEEAVPGLRQALTPDWRGGVCCRVLTGGALVPGATVTLESVSSASPPVEQPNPQTARSKSSWPQARR